MREDRVKAIEEGRVKRDQETDDDYAANPTQQVTRSPTRSVIKTDTVSVA
jgi:hypothetical protein